MNKKHLKKTVAHSHPLGRRDTGGVWGPGERGRWREEETLWSKNLEIMAMRAGQLELKAAWLEHSKLYCEFIGREI